MADFNIAYKLSFINEGGWVNDPNDLGGETYRGIARKYNPNWAGWKYIDSMKSTGKIKKNWTDATADNYAKQFYKNNYWDVAKLDLAKDQDNANQIYDHTLSGLPRAIEAVKYILKNIFNQPVVQNNVMSPSDINILNTVDQKSFFENYKQMRSDFFRYSGAQLAAKDTVYGPLFLKYNKKPSPSNSVYVKGWLNRVNKYAYSGASQIAEVLKKKPWITALVVTGMLIAAVIIVKTIKNGK